ncbi:hypothetical protein BGZ94_008199 [Podila epigama]|nr:hypothetical protein BGZ94_008199 [Podila epigama]
MAQVITDQNIVKGQKQHGFPMRSWKISVVGVGPDDEEQRLPYVDYVEYILHHTFEQPLRKVTEFPFALQEKGWGEFDLKIMFYFVDKSVAPFVLDHDLNFQKNHYEVTHNIPFKADMKPSFLKLLNSGGGTTSEGGHGGENSGYKRRRDGAHKEKSKRIRESRSSDDDDSNIDSSSAGSGDDDGDRVNVKQLAKKLQLLQSDDLLELVKLVKANQTPDMYVTEDEQAAQFSLDMYLLKIRRQNLTVVVHWRFIVQTAITGTFFLWTLITEIDDHIERRKRKRAIRDGSFMTKSKYRQRSYRSCSSIWNIFRFLVYLILCAGLIRLSVETMVRSYRTVFTLPYDRNSPEADGLNWNWYRGYKDWNSVDEVYNPRDLYNCDGYNFDWDMPLTTLCNLDQTTLSAACLIGLFALIEAFMTVIHDTRLMRRGNNTNEYELENGNYHKGVEGHTFNPYPEPLDPVVEAPNYSNAGSVIPHLQQRNQYESAHSQLPVPVPSPPLPPRPIEVPDEVYAHASPIYDQEKEKHVFDGDKKTNPYDDLPAVSTPGTPGVGSSSNPNPNPFNSEWPRDVKN